MNGKLGSHIIVLYNLQKITRFSGLQECNERRLIQSKQKVKVIPMNNPNSEIISIV